MAYTRDFDTSLPVTHTQNKLWPEKIRDVRTDLGERLAAILYGFTAGELDTHIGIKLGRLLTIGTGAPSAPTGTDSAAAFDIYARADGTGEVMELWGIGTGSPNEIQFSKAGKIPNASLEFPFLTGIILPFGGTDAPSGWLLCNGAAVSRTTYADLFAIISDRYGIGDGSTTFNVPDFSDKFPRGVIVTPGTGAGADTHAQTLSGASEAGGSHTHVRGGAGTGWSEGGAVTAVGTPEEHTHAAGTYAISAGDNVPAYTEVMFIIKT